MGDYRYRNKNTGQIAVYPHENARLEYLQNWETLTIDGQDTPDADQYRSPDGEFDQYGAPRSGRGNLIGSSNVGDRIEERHQVPVGTFEPEVEFTEPSKNELRGNHPDPADYHPEKHPQVITVDPSKQVEPIAGPGKRDLSAVVLDENMDLNPNAKPLAGAEDGVLARAHPELKESEPRRQQLIEEQQASRETGDPDAGHTEVQARPSSGDDYSTDGGAHNGVKETTGKEPIGPDPDGRPAKSASKGEWIEWAVKAGADRTEASNMTKTDLVNTYGE